MRPWRIHAQRYNSSWSKAIQAHHEQPSQLWEVQTRAFWIACRSAGKNCIRWTLCSLTLFQETLQHSKQKLELSVQEAQGNLRAIKAKRESEEPQLLRLKEETSALQAEIMQMNQQQSAMLAEINQMKKEDNELTDRIANHKFHIMNSRQENAKLKSQIVESPERLKQVGAHTHLTLTD